MSHPDPPPRPPRRPFQEQIAYGLCILVIWMMALAAILDA